MSTEVVNVLIFLGYALFNGFIAYQFGKEDGWREGFGDGWAAHKRVSRDIEKFSQALFDTGTFWGNDEQAEESGMTEELKPCPFCGGEAQRDSNNAHNGDRMDDWEWFAVYCPNCGCAHTPPFKTTYEAIAAWNRRAQ